MPRSGRDGVAEPVARRADQYDPPMDLDLLGAAAEELLAMRREQRVEADLVDRLRPTDLEDAYAIQDLVVDGALPTGERRVGYKVACTSEIAQAALRIDRPVFGQLMSHTTSPSGTVLDTDRFVHRVVEAEFGFRMASDVTVREGGHTHESIAAHVESVMPSVEIVDHRFESWAVGALPVAADNAIHGWWVHGEPLSDWHHLDLASAGVEVHRNDELVTSGSGAMVLGHPLTVLAWLADELPRFGRPLRAGDFVTTGVTTDVFEAETGDHLHAEFAGIGSVDLSFR